MLKTLSITIAAVALAFSAATVDAKKFGGGKSVGAQRSSVSDAKSGVSPTSAPANAAMAAPAAAGAAAAAAKPSMMSRMAGPLMGIAAGLGLGYLFSQMGAGGFMGFLLIALIGIAAMVYFGRKMMNKQAAATAGGPGMPGAGNNSASPFSRAPESQPLQYAGAGAGAGGSNSAEM